MSITISGNNFKYTFINSEDGDIKSTTTKIEDHNVKFDLFVKTISDSGGSRFIKNSDDVKTSNNTGIFSSLSLTIIEISWNSDNSVGNSSTEIVFSSLFHFT